MVMITCPCCAGKGEIEERAPVPLSPMQFRIYDIVRRSKYGIDGKTLVSRLYANREDGGPVNADISVRVQIVRINERLAPVKLRIGSGTKGHNSPLRIQNLREMCQ